MDESSESEEFYDAEDNTPHRVSKKARASRANLSLPASSTEPNPTITAPDVNVTKKETTVNESPTKLENPVIENEDKTEQKSEHNEGRKWFRELRQRMQTDDEELLANTSPPDSQTSSVEGVFAVPAAKTSHPFRIIERDTVSIHSMTSLGRVGRILAGSSDGSVLPAKEPLQSISGSGSTQSSSETTRDTSPVSAKSNQSASSSLTKIQPLRKDPQTSSLDKVNADDVRPPIQLPLQEPDVIASTKATSSKVVFQQNTIQKSSSANECTGMEPPKSLPIAPPRRKKKNPPTPTSTTFPPLPLEPETISSLAQPLPSPASTIESLTRELENSLDMQVASHSKGKFQQEETKPILEDPANEELTKLKAEIQSLREKNPGIPAAVQNLAANSSNSMGRVSINSSTGLSVSHFMPHQSGIIGKNGLSPRGSKERRRSAGDEEGLMTQMNMVVRTRTDSGKQLSDMEILEQVPVLNLDTGESVPLSVAEDKFPQGINPLSLHIMKLTSEYVSDTNLDKEKESDAESIDSKMSEIPQEKDVDKRTVKRKTERIKKFFGTTVKKTMDKAKSIAQEVSHARHKEDVMDIVDDVTQGEQHIKLKASSSHKGPYEFDSLQHVQDLSGEHQGPVWCMKFSSCGRLLATAGQDKLLRVWVLRSAYTHFQDMRTKYNAEKVSPTPSQESLVSQQSMEDPAITAALLDAEGNVAPFMPKPFCTYTGHTSDLLDVAWSKNYFVLSSSMDKTVRLWHISRKECLCCFQHIDFVTAIVFHPRDDRYFLSGSLDGKLRLWNIPDKKVAVWNELDGQTKLITAANFCQNGKFAVVGSYDGRCIFYNTDQLKYHTTIHVRSTRGKNSTGRKISGIEPMPGEDKILVTSNDSRIRLYDLRDLNLSCKYKGYVNVSSQIKASFSHDGKFIISGSENQCLYIWKTNHDYSKFSSVRRDRNDFWEGIKAHNAVVTCAVFAPNPDSIIKEMEEKQKKTADEVKVDEDPLVAQRTKGCGGYVLVSADFNGCIKVFINKMKPKHSSLPASALA